eukprot:719449-Pyramimonas_sp.AAC.1
MPNQCQGDPNPMPMPCRWGQSFVVDSNENPPGGGNRNPSAKGGIGTRQRNAIAVPKQCQSSVKAMLAQCQRNAIAISNPMPLQCRWGRSFVVDFRRNPLCGGFQIESLCEGRHLDSPAQC